MVAAGSLLVAAMLPGGNAEAALVQDRDGMLIDDFSKKSSTSALGTLWRCFTDRVMGGVSNASHTIDEEDGVTFLRLDGDVSLENNGGFVQVALDLNRRGNELDASAFSGVRLTVRGEGGPYYIHVKNGQTLRHWNYFEAPFSVTDEWRSIDIPFEDFKPEEGEREMDTKTLRRIAVVAAHQAQQADVSVARIEFYQ